jgi:hypothetical protein
MAEELRVIQVLLGPYRDRRLTVSAADADSAISGNWAIDPFAARPDPDNPPPPLSEQERTQAYTAACDWAQQQWDLAQGEDEGNTDNPVARREKRKDMTGDRTGRYTTRGL